MHAISFIQDLAVIMLIAGVVTVLFHRLRQPVVLGYILAGFIIVFLEAITLFGTPALLGIPAGITVATTQLWQFFEFPPRLDAAAAYSLSLIGVTILLLWLQRRFLRRKGFTALTGRW